jgi:hypothetical protein
MVWHHAHVVKYKVILLTFLNYRDRNENVFYTADTEFEQEFLSAITAEEILEWMNVKAFGVGNPAEHDHLPSLIRSSTLSFYKKAISYFIPNKHLKWNVDSRVGNPTMSPDINALIKRLKTLEVRGIGVVSQARRALTIAEFRELVRIAQRDDSIALKLRLPTMSKFQLHLIARIDDTAHVLSQELNIHPHFPSFALQVRLRWTKNCLEERDAPEQIILGSMDHDFCVIAALAVYLQHSLEFGNGDNTDFLFCDNEEDPDQVKRQVSNILLNKILKSPEWKEMQETMEGENGAGRSGFCGTHSMRKLASTMARVLGRTQDEVDARGRWRNTKRISDRYTSISLPVVDATVAASLCIGGPCKYSAKEGSGITDEWLVDEFCPHIASKFGNRVATVLGKALLWSINEPLVMLSIPDVLQNRLIDRYQRVRRLDVDENPIENVPLIVYSVGGQLMIDASGGISDVPGLGAGAGAIGVKPMQGAVGAPNMQAMLAQNNVIRNQNAEILETMRSQFEV